MSSSATTAARTPAATQSRASGSRSSRSPSPRPSRPRGRALIAGLAAVTLGLLAAAGAVIWQQLLSPEPREAGIGVSVPVGGLELTVEAFSRRADATMGVNTAQEPMSGPAMPMAGGTGMGGTGGAGEMADMPGMAGMLEEGQERVDVSVVMANSSGDAITLDPSRFTLYSDGRPVELLAATDSTLTATSLPAGSRMAGNLTFTIALGTTPLELRYADEPIRVILESTTGTSGTTGGDAPAGDPASRQHEGGAHDGDGAAVP